MSHTESPRTPLLNGRRALLADLRAEREGVIVSYPSDGEFAVVHFDGDPEPVTVHKTRVTEVLPAPKHDADAVSLSHTSTHVRATCDDCPTWSSVWYPTRTVEGRTLALRDFDDHHAHMLQGPSRYCTNGCPHLR